jgi:uncharacterized protein with GYD domain
MPKYLFTAQYSSGSWARLVKGCDDRTANVRSLVESLGGSLEAIYWGAHTCAAHAIAELPDGIAAKAAINTALRTGAFASVEATELLSQEQLSDTLLLARSSEQFYEAPGTSAVQAASYL